MRKRNIIAAILMIAMTTSLFTGCKPSVPDDGTNTTEQGNTSATTEATTTEIQKAPVTLYANFDNEVLNDAPTTLPDDGFYYKVFTSVANSFEEVESWHWFFTSGDFFGSLYAPKVDLETYIANLQKDFPNWSDEMCEQSYNDEISAPIQNTESYIADAKESYPALAKTLETARNKININTWGDFAHECLAKKDIEIVWDGNIPNPTHNPQKYYDFEKIDAEVMPKIAALAEAWMEANFMGTPIPEEMTTEDFRTYIDTDAAYAYFASKGILPYKIGNETTRESLQSTGITKEKSREFYATDKVFINIDFEYVNFMMDCTSNLYLQTEDGQEGYYPVHFVIVVKPEKNNDGSWSFKLDYASFNQSTKQMDKFGTINNRKAFIDIDNYDKLYGIY